MMNPFDRELEEKIRGAKKVLYVVVNAALAYYGVVILVRGTVDLFYDEGRSLMFIAIGLVGIRLWLRWTEPWVMGGEHSSMEEGA